MSCKHNNSSFNRFCSECGEVLPRLLCRCGAVNDTDHNFCVACGFDLKEEAHALKTQHKIGKFKLKEFLVTVNDTTISEESKRSVSQDDIDKLMR
jgi:hypothetical protein